MKYFRVFETESNYTDFVNGSDYVTPNLCVIRSTGGTKCKPYIPPPLPPALAGDVAYWDGSKVKTTPYSKWNTSLGTPVGVVVVPTGFAPDGKVRIIGLKGVNSDGNQSNSHVNMKWGVYGTDTSLTNFNRVPTTDNTGSTSIGSNDYGCLPSDNFTGATSFVDPKAKYKSTSNLIPSPYLGDVSNPEYGKEITGYNNALSDFNGLSNTQTLVGLGTGYTAANAAYKYSDGTSNLQWYLPAIGELGYLSLRLKEINETIAALGGVAVPIRSGFWSSSEYSSTHVYYLTTSNGDVYYNGKNTIKYVRPFAILDDGEDSGGDGDKVVNKVQLVNDGLEWDFMFDYPINSDLHINFANGGEAWLVKGKQQYSTGYLSFDKPTIVGIDPLEDDKYIYTW
jgi:hypothetical protein